MRESLPGGRRKYECAGAIAPAPDPGCPLARSPVLRFARTHVGSGAASCSASPREGTLARPHLRKCLGTAAFEEVLDLVAVGAGEFELVAAFESQEVLAVHVGAERFDEAQVDDRGTVDALK